MCGGVGGARHPAAWWWPATRCPRPRSARCGCDIPDLPVIGVIEPGAAAAVAASVSQHIAVIGTEGTIGGGAYQHAIRRLNADARVVAGACSLFVAMAEEGWTDGPIATAVAHRYLDPLFPASAGGAAEMPDTLVLGCTHFPVFGAAIRAVLPEHVRIVDSAATTAAAVARHAAVRQPLASQPGVTPTVAGRHSAPSRRQRPLARHRRRGTLQPRQQHVSRRGGARR